MRKHVVGWRFLLLLLLLLMSSILLLFAVKANQAQNAPGFPGQLEYLDRGTVAIKTEEGVFLSWRLLGTEKYDSSFIVYRNGERIANVEDTTNYVDSKGLVTDRYMVVRADESFGDGKEVPIWADACLRIPLDVPNGGISLDGEE